MARLSGYLMRKVAFLGVICASLCAQAMCQQQMTLADLYQICTSADASDKASCRFYILGVFEGAQITGASAQDKSGKLLELKEKRYCVPEGLAASGMEVAIKIKMGSDLAMFPDDKTMPAVSFVTAVMAHDFACKK